MRFLSDGDVLKAIASGGVYPRRLNIRVDQTQTAGINPAARPEVRQLHELLRALVG